MRYFIATLAPLAIPSVALAQANGQPEIAQLAGLAIICPLLVLLVALLVLLVFVMRRSRVMSYGNYMEMAQDHIERANANMAAQEEKQARVIELLESIERELKRIDGFKSEGVKKV
jgi:hypothetical protein